MAASPALEEHENLPMDFACQGPYWPRERLGGAAKALVSGAQRERSRLARVSVAGSNPVVRSSSAWSAPVSAGAASRQRPLRGTSLVLGVGYTGAMTVLAFSHIALRVADLERSLAFYRGELGFGDVSRLVVRDTPSFREAGLEDAEMVAWFLGRDGTVIELQAVTSRSGRTIPEHLNVRGFRHCGFRVRGVKQTAAELEAAGGTVDWSTHTGNAEVVGEAVFGADPDGQRLEFLELVGGPTQPVGGPLDEPVRPGAGAFDRFDGVAIGVRDLDRATAYYAGPLGATVVERGPEERRLRLGDTDLVLRLGAPGIQSLRFTGRSDADLVDPDGLPIVARTPR
jgi:catechol 2,3-dioxygenase-like lactoylglutathione lyase family enzyme